MKFLYLMPLLFVGCSQWYLVKSVTIDDRDMMIVKATIDQNKTDLENIRAIQKNTRYDWSDFWFGTGYALAEGTGLGFYESKVFYGKNSFPGNEGWFWDWYRMDTSGDQYLKLGHPDKIFRTIWISSGKASWNRYLKFYGGNWVFAYATQFTVSNSLAGMIRKFGKRGEFYFNFEIDWRIIDGLFR